METAIFRLRCKPLKVTPSTQNARGFTRQPSRACSIVLVAVAQHDSTQPPSPNPLITVFPRTTSHRAGLAASPMRSSAITRGVQMSKPSEPRWSLWCSIDESTTTLLGLLLCCCHCYCFYCYCCHYCYCYCYCCYCKSAAACCPGRSATPASALPCPAGIAP